MPDIGSLTFVWPKLLWLLIALPGLVALYVHLLARRRRMGQRLVSLDMASDPQSEYGRVPISEADAAAEVAAKPRFLRALGGVRLRQHVPALLLLLGLCLLLVAIARPRAVIMLPSRVENIVLAMDVSGSMRATDIQPSRLAAAQAAAKAFIAEQPAHAFTRDTEADVIVDPAAGENDLRMIARHLGAMRQVIRIDTDAVTADEAWIERQKIPFGARSRNYVAGIDAERLADRGQLVHEGDVDVALGVFDHLGGFRHLDRRRAVNAGRDNRAVNIGDNIERLLILRRYHLHDGLEAMLCVAGIDALG